MGIKTAEKLTEGIDASQLTILVTGGTNGIGKETVRALAKRGAHVYLAARNLTAAEQVKVDFVKETPSANIDLLKIDLSSLDSVREAAKEFLALNVPLNVLVCNAGMATKDTEFNAAGVEILFATNYLGHALLTNLLLEKIKETATKSGVEGRIVNVASDGHAYKSWVYDGGIIFDKIYQPNTSDYDKTSMSPLKNYGQSKLAQILYTKELAKRLQEEGVSNVTVNSLHPGVVRTNIASIAPFWIKPLIDGMFFLFGVTAAQGAALQTYLAISPEVNGVSGKYFSTGNKECELTLKYALDEDLQKKLWDFTLKLTSV